MKRFLALLATGALTLGLSSAASAQTQGVQGGALVLHDPAAPSHQVTLTVPSNPSAEYTAWSLVAPAGTFPTLNWVAPVPPQNNAQSGFMFTGPLPPAVQPAVPSANEILAYWLFPNQAGFNNNGGSAGAWDYATVNQLGLVTTGGLSPNRVVMTDNLSQLATPSAGTLTTVLHGNPGGQPTFGAVNLTSDVSNVLPVANGGTNSGTALAGSTIMISNGSAIVQGTAGTTTTLLHGNAAGAPTYSAVNLTSDVSNVLPIANGGTNSGAALTGSAVAVSNGTALVQGPPGTTTTVLHGNAAGLPTYGAVNLTSDVSNTLPIANGGTNSNVALTNGKLMVSSGGAIVEGTSSSTPTFSGETLNGNLNITTGGATIVGATLINSAGNPTATTSINAAPGVGGNIVIGNSTSTTNANGTWIFQNLPQMPLAQNHIIVGNASNLEQDVPMTGDVGIAFNLGNGLTTIQPNAVTYSKFQQVAANSLVGNPTGALANATAVPLGTGLTFTGGTTLELNAQHDATLVGNGTTATQLGINLANPNTWTGAQTFSNTTTNGAPLIANNTFANAAAQTALGAQVTSTGAGAGTNTALQLTASGAATNRALDVTAGLIHTPLAASTPVKTDASGNLSAAAINLASSDVTGVLPIANGGTNSGTALAGSTIMISNGSAIVQGTAGTTTTLLHGNAAGAPTYSAVNLTSDVSNVLPIANGGTNSGAALTGSAVAVSNGTALVQGPPGTTTTVLHGNAAGLPTYGAVNLTSDVSNVLPIANGGTNTSTAPNANALVLGNGTGTAYTSLGSTGSTTTVLHGNGAGAPTFGAVNLTSDVSNVLPIANGGTNSGAALTGSAVAVSNGTALVQGPPGTTTTVLHGNAAGLPTYGAVNLTTDVTGILPLANGGTNANLTASNGGIFYSTGTAGAILAGTPTASQVLLSGASGAPSWSTATYPATTTANQLLYSSAANTVTGLTSANNGTLVTGNTGVPSILAGPGTTGNILMANAAAAPSWTTATYPNTATQGDLIMATGANAYGNLSDVATGQVLTSGGVGANPTYSATPTVTSMTLTAATNQLTLGAPAHNTVISATAPAAATQTVTIPDVASNPNMVLAPAGTQNRLIKWNNAAGTLAGNSLLSDDAANLTYNSNFSVATGGNVTTPGTISTTGAGSTFIAGDATHAGKLYLNDGSGNVAHIQSATLGAAFKTYTVPNVPSSATGTFALLENAQTFSAQQQIVQTSVANTYALDVQNQNAPAAGQASAAITAEANGIGAGTNKGISISVTNGTTDNIAVEVLNGRIVSNANSGAANAVDLLTTTSGAGAAIGISASNANGIVSSVSGQGIKSTSSSTTNGDFGVAGIVTATGANQVDAVKGTNSYQAGNGSTADGNVAAASTVATNAPASVNATGNASVTGGVGQYSTGIVLKNGAFGVAGVHPAGHVTGKDFSGAGQTNVTINNPLCTTDSYVLITPRNLGAANALLYVSSVANGSFVVTDALGAATNSADFDYFIITPVAR